MAQRKRNGTGRKGIEKKTTSASVDVEEARGSEAPQERRSVPMRIALWVHARILDVGFMILRVAISAAPFIAISMFVLVYVIPSVMVWFMNQYGLTTDSSALEVAVALAAPALFLGPFLALVTWSLARAWDAYVKSMLGEWRDEIDSALRRKLESRGKSREASAG